MNPLVPSALILCTLCHCVHGSGKPCDPRDLRRSHDHKENAPPERMSPPWSLYATTAASTVQAIDNPFGGVTE
jgi:hypothetical protein